MIAWISKNHELCQFRHLLPLRRVDTGGRTGECLPACLLSAAIETAVDETVPAGPGQAPVSRGRPAGFPCELGAYRLIGFLGRGGMGTVYEAEHIASGRRVALKMLEQELDSPELRRRFLREGAGSLRGVNHPNSLYVFGSEQIEGIPVITMEIAGGGTLQEWS